MYDQGESKRKLTVYVVETTLCKLLFFVSTPLQD